MKKTLLLLLVGLLSCEAHLDESTTFVRTEDIVYVSGERLILTGRIISQGPLDIADHGFMIDSTESFSNPLILSLGARELPGRFVAETDALNAQTNYYGRAFANVGSTMLTGKEVSFATFSLDLEDFQPRIAFGDQRITIFGSNFAKDAQVFFDDEPATVLSIAEESIIQVRTPPMGDKVGVQVRVESQGFEKVFPYNFEYIIGTWNEAGNFPLNEACYSEVIAMRNENTVIFGLGARRDRKELNEEIFSLDITSGAWGSVPMLAGQPVMSGFASWPYIGSGSYERVSPAGRGPLFLSTDFWHFDGNQFNRLPNLPFAQYKAMALTVDNDLYIIGGQRADRAILQTTFKYDPDIGEWQSLQLIPTAVNSDYPHFSHGQYLYVLAPDRWLYRFDTTTNAWKKLDLFPASVGRKGIAEVIGDKAYLGLFENSTLIWEYDLNELRWRPKTSFPGDFREGNVATWVWEEALHVLRTSRFSSSPNMEIWQFHPDKF